MDKDLAEPVKKAEKGKQRCSEKSESTGRASKNKKIQMLPSVPHSSKQADGTTVEVNTILREQEEKAQFHDHQLEEKEEVTKAAGHQHVPVGSHREEREAEEPCATGKLKAGRGFIQRKTVSLSTRKFSVTTQMGSFINAVNKKFSQIDKKLGRFFDELNLRVDKLEDQVDILDNLTKEEQLRTESYEYLRQKHASSDSDFDFNDVLGWLYQPNEQPRTECVKQPIHTATEYVALQPEPAKMQSEGEKPSKVNGQIGQCAHTKRTRKHFKHKKTTAKDDKTKDTLCNSFPVQPSGQTAELHLPATDKSVAHPLFQPPTANKEHHSRPKKETNREKV